MSFSTHAVCDRCEAKLLCDNEDSLLEEGWLTVCYGAGIDDRRDFCSLPCVLKWAGSDGARELLESVASRTEDE